MLGSRSLEPFIDGLRIIVAGASLPIGASQPQNGIRLDATKNDPLFARRMDLAGRKSIAIGDDEIFLQPNPVASGQATLVLVEQVVLCGQMKFPVRHVHT